MSSPDKSSGRGGSGEQSSRWLAPICTKGQSAPMRQTRNTFEGPATFGQITDQQHQQQQKPKSLILIDRNGHLNEQVNQNNNNKFIGHLQQQRNDNNPSFLSKFDQLKLSDGGSRLTRRQPNSHGNQSNLAANKMQDNKVNLVASFCFGASNLSQELPRAPTAAPIANQMHPMEASQAPLDSMQHLNADSHLHVHLQHSQNHQHQQQHQQVMMDDTGQRTAVVMMSQAANEKEQRQQVAAPIGDFQQQQQQHLHQHHHQHGYDQQQHWMEGHDANGYVLSPLNASSPHQQHLHHHHHHQHHHNHSVSGPPFDFMLDQNGQQYQQQPTSTSSGLGGAHEEAHKCFHPQENDCFIGQAQFLDCDSYLHQHQPQQAPNLLELDNSHQQTNNSETGGGGQLEYVDLDAQQQQQQHRRPQLADQTRSAGLPESVIKSNDQLASCSFASSISQRSQAGQHQQFSSSYGLSQSMNLSVVDEGASGNRLSSLDNSHGHHHNNHRQMSQSIGRHCNYSQSGSYSTTTSTALSNSQSSQQTLLSDGHQNHHHHNQLHNHQHQHQHLHQNKPQASTTTNVSIADNNSSHHQHSTLDHSVGSDTSSLGRQSDEPEIKVCEWEGCGNTFLEMGDFVRHLEERHVNLEPREKNRYYCLWSNCKRNEQEFNARYKLLIHMRVHSGEKPYPCQSAACSKSFSRLENLKIHQRSHTGEKPYRCKNYPACSKSFTNSSDRIKHHKTHQNPKPYTCSYDGCSKRYTDPSSLRKHLRAHKRHKRPNTNSHTSSSTPGGPMISGSYAEQQQQQQPPVQAMGNNCCLPTSDYDPSVVFGLDCAHQMADEHQAFGAPPEQQPHQQPQQPQSIQWADQQHQQPPSRRAQVSFQQPADDRWQQPHSQFSRSWCGPRTNSEWTPESGTHYYQQQAATGQHWNEQSSYSVASSTPVYEQSWPDSRPQFVQARHQQLMRSMPSRPSGHLLQQQRQQPPPPPPT